MKHPLISCSCKLDRAATHFNALYKQVGEYVRDEEPFSFLPEIDVEKARYIMRIEINRPPPPELSLIAGDFIQNVRAALDHLIWQLVGANGQRPGRGNAFPILSQPPTAKNGGREKWNRQMRGVHPTACRWIDLTQPYRRGNAIGDDALILLSKLCNEDKHRVVLGNVVGVAHPEQAQPQLNITPIRDVGTIESYQLKTRKPLKDGDVLLEAAIEITGSNPEINLDGDLPLEIAFGKALVTLEGLSQIFDRADLTIGHLANVTFGSNIAPQPLRKRLGI